MEYAIYVEKTKALISFEVTAQQLLICTFVFIYAKKGFLMMHDAAHLMTVF